MEVTIRLRPGEGPVRSWKERGRVYVPIKENRKQELGTSSWNTERGGRAGDGVGELRGTWSHMTLHQEFKCSLAG